uniref:Calponin-homology (CH) domain-containing protein n=1 Tax=Arcella intermedia TaxID=1963864 RepID=A0A6B2LGR2_9EUKA
MTCVRWINHKLEEKGQRMSDINTISDGITLVTLVEELIGGTISGVVSPPTSAKEKMENIALAIDAFEKFSNSTIEGISIPLLLNSNLKAIMDLVWSLIYITDIKPLSYGGFTDRFALFKWAMDRTEHQNIQILNFTTSWQDGMAFCAIMNSGHPGFDFEGLQEYKVLDNLRLAFKFAEEKWQVPKLLDPNDVSEDPDETSLIIYLSLLFRKIEA